MAIFLGTFLAAAPPARAEVLADIVAIGYPFQNGWGYRQGNWTPVVVEVALLNQTAFDGRLRLQQPDRDGDRVPAIARHLPGRFARNVQRCRMAVRRAFEGDRRASHCRQLLVAV
ncbi:MAG: hypothetical protein IH988_07325, partial [Planctomycetes bacterium]|nr:hypothetical protein [Planctomycetota bacterium]